MVSFILSLYFSGLYKPIYNLIIFTYNLTPGPSFGLAIIGIAILIRFVFLYFTLLGYKHDKQLAEIKPLIARVEADQSLSSREKMDRVSQLLRPHGINPFLTSIPIFAQIIFLAVLYQIIQSGIYKPGLHNLYSFVGAPSTLNTLFFGFNLAKRNILLSLLAGFSLFLERVWEYNDHKDLARQTLSQKWDPIIWPAGTFIILILLPSAKAIFLMTSVAFSAIIKGIVHLTRR